MSRDNLFAEIEEALGLVPGFFQGVLEDSLKIEWNLFKHYVFKEQSKITW